VLLTTFPLIQTAYFLPSFRASNWALVGTIFFDFKGGGGANLFFSSSFNSLYFFTIIFPFLSFL